MLICLLVLINIWFDWLMESNITLKLPHVSVSFFAFLWQVLHLGPTQVKCPLLISSNFDAMNFQHFLELNFCGMSIGSYCIWGRAIWKKKKNAFELFDNTIFSIRKHNKKTSKIIDSRKKWNCVKFIWGFLNYYRLPILVLQISWALLLMPTAIHLIAKRVLIFC